MSADITTIVTARAFAKINLTLRVLGTRADGFHELRTTFQSIALHDTLALCVRRGPFEIETNDPACPIDRSNLVWRAAVLVWRAAGRRGAPTGVQVRLKKRIPTMAGLGGGSSDAAAALRSFTSLWRVRLPAGRLRAMGAALGSDVPFFLQGGTALGVDRGDVLFPLADRPSTWVVLAVPNLGVSTREAYGWFDRLPAYKRRSEWHGSMVRRGRGVRVDQAAIPDEAGNDLELAVAARHPQITRLVRALRRAGADYAAMSGSGSAVFGLFSGRKPAEAAASALAKGTVRTFVTRNLTRARHAKLSEPRSRFL